MRSLSIARSLAQGHLMTTRSLASSSALKRWKRPPVFSKTISVSSWICRSPSCSRNFCGGRLYLSIMVWACLSSWEMALRSLEFCMGLFSGFAFAVEVPIGCEDLQVLEVL